MKNRDIVCLTQIINQQSVKIDRLRASHKAGVIYRYGLKLAPFVSSEAYDWPIGPTKRTYKVMHFMRHLVWLKVGPKVTS